MRKCLYLYVPCCLFLAVAGCERGHSPDAAASSAPTAVVTHVVRQDLASTLKVVGQFQPYQEVDLHAKVSGYIRQINVDIGDRVRKGQIICTLEVPELTAQVSGAKAQVRQSESEIARAESEIARAESNYNAVHSAFTRLEQASKDRPGLIAQQELDDSRAKDQDAAAQISVAKASMDSSKQQLQVSEADTQRVQTLSDYSMVTAPFNGVVTKRYADTGSLIQAGTASNTQALPVVRVAQSDVLRLRMPVPEADVLFIKQGGLVQVHVQAADRVFTGNIIRFSRALDSSTRTMLVEVDVPNADLSLSPGMFAETVITLQQRDNTTAVPSEAIVTADQPYVLTVDSSNKVDKRNVTLGIQGEKFTEVLSGLSPGDSVIVSGQLNYQSGQTVRPISGGQR